MVCKFCGCQGHYLKSCICWRKNDFVCDLMVTKIHFKLNVANMKKGDYDKSIIDLTAKEMKNMPFDEIKQIITDDKDTYIKVMKSWRDDITKYGSCENKKNILRTAIHRFSRDNSEGKQKMLTKQQADKITIKHSEHLKVIKKYKNEIDLLKDDIKQKNKKMNNMKKASEILKKGYYDSLLLMEEEWKGKLNGEKLAHRNKCRQGGCGQDEQIDCVICQDVIGAANSCTLGCGHTYHLSCIATWMVNEKNTCPTCRAEQDGFKPAERTKCILHGISDCQHCYLMASEEFIIESETENEIISV